MAKKKKNESIMFNQRAYNAPSNASSASQELWKQQDKWVANNQGISDAQFEKKRITYSDADRSAAINTYYKNQQQRDVLAYSTQSDKYYQSNQSALQNTNFDERYKQVLSNLSYTSLNSREKMWLDGTLDTDMFFASQDVSKMDESQQYYWLKDPMNAKFKNRVDEFKMLDKKGLPEEGDTYNRDRILAADGSKSPSMGILQDKLSLEGFRVDGGKDGIKSAQAMEGTAPIPVEQPKIPEARLAQQMKAEEEFKKAQKLIDQQQALSEDTSIQKFYKDNYQDIMRDTLNSLQAKTKENDTAVADGNRPDYMKSGGNIPEGLLTEADAKKLKDAKNPKTKVGEFDREVAQELYMDTLRAAAKEDDPERKLELQAQAVYLSKSINKEQATSTPARLISNFVDGFAVNALSANEQGKIAEAGLTGEVEQWYGTRKKDSGATKTGVVLSDMAGMVGSAVAGGAAVGAGLKGGAVLAREMSTKATILGRAAAIGVQGAERSLGLLGQSAAQRAATKMLYATVGESVLYNTAYEGIQETFDPTAGDFNDRLANIAVNIGMDVATLGAFKLTGKAIAGLRKNWTKAVEEPDLYPETSRVSQAAVNGEQLETPPDIQRLEQEAEAGFEDADELTAAAKAEDDANAEKEALRTEQVDNQTVHVNGTASPVRTTPDGLETTIDYDSFMGRPVTPIEQVKQRDWQDAEDAFGSDLITSIAQRLNDETGVDGKIDILGLGSALQELEKIDMNRIKPSQLAEVADMVDAEGFIAQFEKTHRIIDSIYVQRQLADGGEAVTDTATIEKALADEIMKLTQMKMLVNQTPLGQFVETDPTTGFLRKKTTTVENETIHLKRKDGTAGRVVKPKAFDPEKHVKVVTQEQTERFPRKDIPRDAADQFAADVSGMFDTLDSLKGKIEPIEDTARRVRTLDELEAQLRTALDTEVTRMGDTPQDQLFSDLAEENRTSNILDMLEQVESMRFSPEGIKHDMDHLLFKADYEFNPSTHVTLARSIEYTSNMVKALDDKWNDLTAQYAAGERPLPLTKGGEEALQASIRLAGGDVELGTREFFEDIDARGAYADVFNKTQLKKTIRSKDALLINPMAIREAQSTAEARSKDLITIADELMFGLKDGQFDKALKGTFDDASGAMNPNVLTQYSLETRHEVSAALTNNYMNHRAEYATHVRNLQEIQKDVQTLRTIADTFPVIDAATLPDDVNIPRELMDDETARIRREKMLELEGIQQAPPEQIGVRSEVVGKEDVLDKVVYKKQEKSRQVEVGKQEKDVWVDKEIPITPRLSDPASTITTPVDVVYDMKDSYEALIPKERSNVDIIEMEIKSKPKDNMRKFTLGLAKERTIAVTQHYVKINGMYAELSELQSNIRKAGGNISDPANLPDAAKEYHTRLLALNKEIMAERGTVDALTFPTQDEMKAEVQQLVATVLKHKALNEKGKQNIRAEGDNILASLESGNYKDAYWYKMLYAQRIKAGEAVTTTTQVKEKQVVPVFKRIRSLEAITKTKKVDVIQDVPVFRDNTPKINKLQKEIDAMPETSAVNFEDVAKYFNLTNQELSDVITNGFHHRDREFDMANELKHLSDLDSSFNDALAKLNDPSLLKSGDVQVLDEIGVRLSDDLKQLEAFSSNANDADYLQKIRDFDLPTITEAYSKETPTMQSVLSDILMQVAQRNAALTPTTKLEYPPALIENASPHDLRLDNPEPELITEDMAVEELFAPTNQDLVPNESPRTPEQEAVDVQIAEQIAKEQEAATKEMDDPEVTPPVKSPFEGSVPDKYVPSMWEGLIERFTDQVIKTRMYESHLFGGRVPGLKNSLAARSDNFRQAVSNRFSAKMNDHTRKEWGSTVGRIGKKQYNQYFAIMHHLEIASMHQKATENINFVTENLSDANLEILRDLQAKANNKELPKAERSAAYRQYKKVAGMIEVARELNGTDFLVPRLFNIPGIKPGSTPDELMGMAKMMEKKFMNKGVDINTLHTLHKQVADETLKTRLDAGILSKEDYDAITSAYQHWIPTADDLDRLYEDPGRALFREKAEATQTGTPLNGSKGVLKRDWIEPTAAALPENIREIKLEAVDALVYNTFRSERAALANEHLTAIIDSYKSLLGSDTPFGRIKKGDAVGADPENFLTVWRDGKQEVYSIPTPFKPAINLMLKGSIDGTERIAEHARGFKAFVENPIKAVGQGAATLMRSGTTAHNPMFIPVAVMRDIFQSVNREGASILMYYPHAIMQEITGSGKARELRQFGSNQTPLQQTPDEYLFESLTRGGKAWKAMKNILEVGGIGTNLENITRNAIALQKEGTISQVLGNNMDEFDVNYHAGDYMNYSRGGTVTRELNRYIPYLNVAVEGIRKDIGATKDNLSFKNGLDGFVGATTGSLLAAGAVTLSAVMAREKAFEQDDQLRAQYDALPEFTKMSFHVIPTENGFIKIPKGMGIVTLYSNLLEGMIEDDYSSIDQDAANGVLEKHGLNGAVSAGATFLNMPTENPLFSTMLEVGTNYDFFTEKPIVPEYLQDQVASGQMKSETYTSGEGAFGVKVAGMLANMGVDSYPANINQVADSIGGTMGRVVYNEWLGNALKAMDGDAVNPEQRYKFQTGVQSADEGMIGRQVSGDNASVQVMASGFDNMLRYGLSRFVGAPAASYEDMQGAFDRYFPYTDESNREYRKLSQTDNSAYNQTAVAGAQYAKNDDITILGDTGGTNRDQADAMFGNMMEAQKSDEQLLSDWKEGTISYDEFSQEKSRTWGNKSDKAGDLIEWLSSIKN